MGKMNELSRASSPSISLHALTVVCDAVNQHPADDAGVNLIKKLWDEGYHIVPRPAEPATMPVCPECGGWGEHFSTCSKYPA